MLWRHCLFLSAVSTAYAFKIDLQGSVNVGAKVAEFLTHHLQDELEADVLSGRRYNTDALEELAKVVRQMRPCKNISICTPPLEKLLKDYVLDLTLAVKSIFDGVLEDELCKVKYFQKCLKHVKKVIKKSASDADEVYRWLQVLKKISGIYVEQAVLLVKQGLAKAEKKELATSVLKEQLVLKIVAVERQYQVRLCREFTFCPYQFDTTIYLQLLLNLIKNLDESKVKLFLNQFKSSYLRAPMFTEDEMMKRNFEDVLNEMLMNSTISAKDVIMSIGEIVQKRLAVTVSTESDASLLQMILSDMDHIYVNNKDEHIEKFLDAVKAWTKSGHMSTLEDGMETFYNNLASHFSNQPSEIVFKLKAEAQVFLALTANSPATLR